MEDDYGTTAEDLLDMANQAGVKLEFAGRDPDFNEERMNTYGDKDSLKKFMNLIFKDKSTVQDALSDIEENSSGGSSSSESSDKRANSFLKEHKIKGSPLKRHDVQGNKCYSTNVTKNAVSKLLTKIGSNLKSKRMDGVAGTTYEGVLPNAGRIHINVFDRNGSKAAIFFHD